MKYDLAYMCPIDEFDSLIVIQATPIPAAPPSDRPGGDLDRSLCMSPLGS